MPSSPDSRIGAAIDVGSTSVHLLVARLAGPAGGFLETLVDESAILGLGERVNATGGLGNEAIEVLVETIDRYLRTAAEHGSRGTAIVATDPLRRAADAAAAVHAVGTRLGAVLHVLSPDEEALCTLVGVTGGRRLTADTAVLDIGGGSTEIVAAGPAREPRAVGVAIGAIRLTATLVAHDPPTAEEIEGLRSAARAAFEGVARLPLESLVAVGGTTTNLGKVAARAAADRDGSARLTLDDVEAVLRRLSSESAEAVATDAAIRPGRVRILPAGAAILEAVLGRWGLDSVELSSASLRDGLVHLQLEAGDDWRSRLAELAGGWR